jgi:hypothetical protein
VKRCGAANRTCDRRIQHDVALLAPHKLIGRLAGDLHMQHTWRARIWQAASSTRACSKGQAGRRRVRAALHAIKLPSCCTDQLPSTVCRADFISKATKWQSSIALGQQPTTGPSASWKKAQVSSCLSLRRTAHTAPCQCPRQLLFCSPAVAGRRPRPGLGQTCRRDTWAR